MTHHPLQSWGNSGWGSLLLVHSRCSLSPSTCCSLGVEILRLGVLPRLLGLHHWHLLTVWRSLCRIRWGSTLVVRRVHVIVRVWLRVRVWLWVRVLRSILIHLHVGVCRVLCCLSLLCSKSLLLLLSPLLGHALEALLLLDARGWRAAGARFQRHWWHEWASELGLRDEWVKLGLRRRPSFQRVEVEQSLRKINKSGSVGHFYARSAYIRVNVGV